MKVKLMKKSQTNWYKTIQFKFKKEQMPHYDIYGEELV